VGEAVGVLKEAEIGEASAQEDGGNLIGVLFSGPAKELWDGDGRDLNGVCHAGIVEAKPRAAGVHAVL
jgi:hypothetical protein